jgi:NAD(P)-dependent dehydrogenase (short-subunit alcohol dehydrogenase family)
MFNIDLTDKTIIISGVSGNIGGEIAKMIKRCGGSVIGIDLARPNNDITQYVDYFFTGNASSESSVSDFYDEVAKSKYFEKLDAVVCCAGTKGQLHDAENLNALEFVDCINSSVLSSALLIKYFTTEFKIRRKGNFILFSSTAGFKGNVLQPAYSAAKHAVNGLMKSYARELGPFGIRINSILPGLIISDMAKAINYELDSRKNKALGNLVDYKIPENSSDNIPLRRLGMPVDIANLVVFLLSPLSSYVHGAMINIDGGLLTK